MDKVAIILSHGIVIGLQFTGVLGVKNVLLAEMYLVEKELKLAVNYLKLLEKAGVIGKVEFTLTTRKDMIRFEGFDDMSDELRRLKREVKNYYTYLISYEEYFKLRGLSSIPLDQLFTVVMRTHLGFGVTKLEKIQKALEEKKLDKIYDEIISCDNNYKPPFKFENKTTNVSDVHYEGLFWVYKLDKTLVA